MHDNQEHNQNVFIIACDSHPFPLGTITPSHIKCSLIAHIHKVLVQFYKNSLLLALHWAAVLLLHLADLNVQLLDAFWRLPHN